MGIECWWQYDPEYDIPSAKTCPECGGSGKDNVTLNCDCWRCKGSGKIDLDDKG